MRGEQELLESWSLRNIFHEKKRNSDSDPQTPVVRLAHDCGGQMRLCDLRFGAYRGSNVEAGDGRVTFAPVAEHVHPSVGDCGAAGVG